MNSNFGKYDIPPTLQKLIDLQTILSDREQFYHGFNFYLSLGNFRYFNTPSDVIVFGNIGVDGIHYGILTDYGSVNELEAAPIVCVSPMDFDRPIRLVANNLCEFLRINMKDSELFYNQFESEEKYLKVKEQWREEAENSPYQPTEYEEFVKQRVSNFLIEDLKVPNIDNPYQYVQTVKQERQRNISIQTQDGLGVTTPLLPGEEHIHFPIDKDVDPDLEMLQGYLSSQPKSSRLAVLRDLQLNYVLKDYPELFKIVIHAMINMELIDEAKRIYEDN
ncbi:hypothetical protein KHA96_08610 [Bacillus sp. FJAT-49711]|uniref:hypothetical protein n=1 Tax=Bacillus sp. FJAT-49711 TaxID=2833585 RepID=UPI001BC979D0|nr:hypothetical protein [Bacillus sp. FJAT-49711]MBS4218371.1 hypothetical protein [Bacillus sp. FJAT-49711]